MSIAKTSRQTVVRLLRRGRLLEFADAVRLQWLARQNRGARALFAQRHGSVALPPDALAYDAYGTLDWEFYWSFGMRLAEYLAGLIRQHADGGKVLEWGCGPARVLRHLPGLLGATWKIYGCDYNQDTVRWCSENIPGVTFLHNDPAPPLPFESGQFDCVLAVSVLTHLSERMHRAWMTEIRRVLRSNGIAILSTHGDGVRSLLRPAERVAYERGSLVVRDRVMEGKRLFVAYHPEQFVQQELLAGFNIVRHDRSPASSATLQDFWIVQKSD
jgi:SAM-dependent methyltransferase